MIFQRKPDFGCSLSEASIVFEPNRTIKAVGGFAGVAQDPETGSLSPNIAWAIRRDESSVLWAKLASRCQKTNTPPGSPNVDIVPGWLIELEDRLGVCLVDGGRLAFLPLNQLRMTDEGGFSVIFANLSDGSFLVQKFRRGIQRRWPGDSRPPLDLGSWAHFLQELAEKGCASLEPAPEAEASKGTTQ